jgi:hypothetical protein
MPVFAGFRSSMKPGESYAKIIMAITEQEQIDFMLEELKNSGVNFIEDEIGKIVVIPTQKVY